MCHAHFHKTCSRKFLKKYRNFAYCKECLNNFYLIKYNPYYETLAEMCNENELKPFANNEPPESIEILEEYSKILENCENLTISQYNKAVSEKNLSNGNPLTLQFVNIDGNASNFDSLATTIAKFKNKVSIIGLAETNTLASNDKLYKLDGYNSLYMDKLCDKKKGSGVAIYFQENITTERIDELSFINKDIEILFVKLSLNENNIFVGIIYRPPNGDVQKFHDHFSETMSKFNKSDKICIMDDFNITLFENSSNTRKFEENLLCINDLKYCHKFKHNNLGFSANFVLYADDTNVFISCKSPQDCISVANKVLESMNMYMLRNLLHINLDKSYYMHFPPKIQTNIVENSITDTAIYIGEVKIKKVDEIRFLGVTIDNKLSWDAHITNFKKKLKATLAVISRISPYIQPENYKALYHTLFESHLTYCISSWGGVASHKTDTLFRIQKKCLRILYGDREEYVNKFCTAARTRQYGEQLLDNTFYEHEHSKTLFNENGIMNFKNLYTYMTSNVLLKNIQY